MNASSRRCPHAFRFILSTVVVEVPDDDEPYDAMETGAEDDELLELTDLPAREAKSQPILQVGAPGEASFFVRCTLHRAGISNPVIEIKDGNELCDYLTVAMLQNEPPAVVLLHLDAMAEEQTDVLGWMRRRPELDGVAVVAVAAGSTPVRMGDAFDLHIAANTVETALPILLWAVSRSG